MLDETPLLAPAILDAVKILVTRDPAARVPAAVRTLREYANLTQAQVAQRFQRRSTAVTNWEKGTREPPRGMTIPLLELFQIPAVIIREFLTRDSDAQLNASAYLQCDAITIEYDYFLRTRGEVLQALKARAVEGSDKAAVIYREWMQDNERLHAARESSPRRVASSSITSAWVKSAMRTALTTTSSDATPSTDGEAGKSSVINEGDGA